VGLLGVLLHVVLQTASAQTPSAPLSTAQIASRSVPATVTVMTVDANGDTIGHGSGFLLGSFGVLVTNWHVLRGAVAAAVALPDGRRYEQVSFFRGDSLADIALLKISASGLPTLTPCDTEPEVGEPVVAIGSPLGFAGTVSVGIVSATRVENGVNVLQISAPLSPGSSGGPVLDTEGCVVAVAAAYVEEAPYIGFATPVRYVTRLLDGPATERPLEEVFGAAASDNVEMGGDRASTTDMDLDRLDVYQAAARGEPEAEYQLGLRYVGGLGVPRDDVAATAWFRRAAQKGLARAQYNLGAMYAVGLGVEQNDVEAARWVRMAAEQGVAEAQHDLGMFYASGAGVGEDPSEAARWYREAAEQGHARAQFCLGAMYRTGRGVPRNDVRAAQWYRVAADEGLVEAQHNLGVMYALGEGVPQDLVQAYQWLNLAATAQSGEPSASAARTLDDLARQMRPAQIAEAQRRSMEWRRGANR
jgi:TPR repeat protein